MTDPDDDDDPDETPTRLDQSAVSTMVVALLVISLFTMER
jgi:hypothetical protein